MMPFHPWVDGDVLHGRAHESPLPAIPLVVGTTAHEMELFRDQVPVLPPDIAVPYLAGKAANLGITDDDVRAHRVRRRRPRHGRGGRRPRAARAQRDPRPRPRGARATRCTATGSCGRRPMRRACHALDLPFTFGTFDVSTWREFAGATGERAAACRGAVGAHARGVDVVRRHRHAERRGRRSLVDRRSRVPRASPRTPTTPCRTAPRSGWETRERVGGEGRDRHRREPGHRQGHRARARRGGRDRLRHRPLDQRGRPSAAGHHRRHRARDRRHRRGRRRHAASRSRSTTATTPRSRRCSTACSPSTGTSTCW